MTPNMELLIYVSLGWIAFNGVLLLFRIPFSKHKSSRIKIYFKGILFVKICLALVFISNVVQDTLWYKVFIIRDYSSITDPTLTQMAFYGGCVLWFIALFSALLGSMLYLLSSWESNDLEIWNETH